MIEQLDALTFMNPLDDLHDWALGSIDKENTVVSPLVSGVGILISVLIVLALALIVLLIVTVYRKHHGYKEKSELSKRDERQWWANPYDISNMMPGEEQSKGSNFSIEPIPEDSEARKPASYDEKIARQSEAVSFCRKCGKHIPDDSLFCQYCGTKIKS